MSRLMSEEQLGFDSTITTAGDKQHIKTERDDFRKHLVMDKVMKRVACVAGRATTCWIVPNTSFVIKDS